LRAHDFAGGSCIAQFAQRAPLQFAATLIVPSAHFAEVEPVGDELRSVVASGAPRALAFVHKMVILGERGWRGFGGIGIRDLSMSAILTSAADRACMKGACLLSQCGYSGVKTPIGADAASMLR
jgi:hypothetical protein